MGKVLGHRQECVSENCICCLGHIATGLKASPFSSVSEGVDTALVWGVFVGVTGASYTDLL